MSLLLAAAIATATANPPAKAANKPPAARAKEVGKPESKAVDPAEAMAMMTKVFDRLFPPGPEPEPARLAAARGAAVTMFPKDAYAKAMIVFADGLATRVLDMSEADLAALIPEDPPAKGKKAKKPKAPPSTEPLRVKLARDDPQFDAKYAAGRAFLVSVMTKIGNAAEPSFREGLARALARKFDLAQIGEINAFLATPTGAKYGRDMLGIWFAPDVMRASMQVMPEIMKMAPELAGDAAAFDAIMKAGKKDEPKKP